VESETYLREWDELMNQDFGDLWEVTNSPANDENIVCAVLEMTGNPYHLEWQARSAAGNREINSAARGSAVPREFVAVSGPATFCIEFDAPLKVDSN
jgi:hypothetical protein